MALMATLIDLLVGRLARPEMWLGCRSKRRPYAANPSVSIKFIEGQTPFEMSIKLQKILSQRVENLNEAYLHRLYESNLPREFGLKTRIFRQSAS